MKTSPGIENSQESSFLSNRENSNFQSVRYDISRSKSIASGVHRILFNVNQTTPFVVVTTQIRTCVPNNPTISITYLTENSGSYGIQNLFVSIRMLNMSMD